MKPTSDSRFPQANKEALYTLIAYGLYFLWWYGTAYGLGDADPATYTYIWGFPEWFFYSCIVGYPLACVMVWVLTRFFSHVSLEADAPEADAQNPQPAQDADVKASSHE